MSALKFIITISGFLIAGVAQAQMDAQFDLNVKDSPIRGVLEMIAAKSGLQLVMNQDPNVNISLSQTGATARQLLDQIATDQQMEYTISGNQLIITRRVLGGSIGDSHLIHVQYANATDVAGKLKAVVGGDERIVVDERENNLIFMGSRGNYEKVKSLITLLDTVPKQIMIEALIVETSHSFMQDLGISIAGFGDSINTPGPRQPYGTFKTVLDNLNSKSLEVRLNVAESKGDAKVISRPKVITLNNKTARVQSGVTYHVKTLSNVVSGDQANQVTQRPVGNQVAGIAAGGLTTVQAGLSLNILPSLVGTDEVRLVVDIDNSTSDMGSAVDGIPGIFKNSANTNVIVKNRQTAVIAGLIKQEKSKNNGGVPILSDIPLIGLLFKSSSKADQNNELVIFLTPTVGNPETAHVDPETGKLMTPALAIDAPVKN
jgi:type IV pilus assembly protein PilQ